MHLELGAHWLTRRIRREGKWRGVGPGRSGFIVDKAGRWREA